MVERRKHPRRKISGIQELKIRFEESTGPVEVQARVRDTSENGIGVETSRRVRIGTRVLMDGELATEVGKRRFQNVGGRVVSCISIRIGLFATGIQFDGADEQPSSSYTHTGAFRAAETPAQDYYEILQVNPNAEPETIHRVYRLLAQRYHPDNVDTGDEKRFAALLEAYQVLSDPEKRAAHDVGREGLLRQRTRLLDHTDGGFGREAEKRKRQVILGLLYKARLSDPAHGSLTLLEFERLLGCPREHLEFSLWYLKESGLILFGDNGKYSITIKGVDQAELLPMVEAKLLNAAG